MLKLRHTILFLLIITFKVNAQILPSFGNSRTGTTGFQFLKIAPDARSSALSGCSSSMLDDVSAVFWNPAGLTQLDSSKYHFQFGHTSYYAGIDLNYGGFSFTKNHLNYWALSIINLSSGEMPVTTEFEPSGNGLSFSVSNFLLGLSFAKVLSDNFSFGITGKYVYEDIFGVKTQNGIFDFGFVYNLGIKRLTKFAIGISNFGFNVSPQGNVVITTLNGDKQLENFENIAVPSVFRLGVSTNLINKQNKSLVAAIQLNHPTDNNETLSIGFEYFYRKILFLRTGYEFGADQTGWPSAGLGIKLQRYFGGLVFDYSFNNKSLLGNIHRITVGVNLK